VNMKRTIPLLAIALIAPAAAAAPAKPGLVLIQTESRIDIDAQGKVTAIHTTPQLPPEIEKIVEDNLRKLQYAAPIQDGKPVAGVTYALQEACAAPVDGKYGFAVKYLGNGPSMDRRSFPFYPREMQRRGIESKWTVEYSVAPDGKGGVVAMKLKEGGGDRGEAQFKQALEYWIRTTHFEPEQLDGRPVATRMSVDVDFVLGHPASAAEREQNKAANESCRVALEAHDDPKRAVALDSPFKLNVAAN